MSLRSIIARIHKATADGANKASIDFRVLSVYHLSHSHVARASLAYRPRNAAYRPHSVRVSFAHRSGRSRIARVSLACRFVSFAYRSRIVGIARGSLAYRPRIARVSFRLIRVSYELQASRNCEQSIPRESKPLQARVTGPRSGKTFETARYDRLVRVEVLRQVR